MKKFEEESNYATLNNEADRIFHTSGISLSNNAHELKYGSKEWHNATSEGAWRSYRAREGKVFFLKYDGSMFYEVNRPREVLKV